MGVIRQLLAAFVLLGITWAQQPQTSDVANTQPLYPVNAKYVQGVGPGYWPTAGSGLTLNLTAGTVWCLGTIRTYAGGTLTMTNSTTNYVYLNPASNCVPASSTSTFSSSQIPIAIIVAAGGVITSITDDRGVLAAFNATSIGAGTVTSVDWTLPGGMAAGGGPITGSGTLAGTWNVAAAGYMLVSTAANTAAWHQINGGVDCGDGTHAVNWTASSQLFGCQTITASGGSFSNAGLADPAAVPTVTTTGSAGSTSYGYCVVANLTASSTTSGGVTACSPAAWLTTGNATLTSSNYNNISWTAITGASSYSVYRSYSGGTPNTSGKLTTGDCVAVAGTSCHDKGETADATQAPAQNTTGQTVAASYGTAGGYGTVDPRKQVYLKDEFCGAAGDLGWTTTGTITVTYPASPVGANPCLVELNANGTTGTISLGNGAGAFFINPGGPLIMRAYAKMVSNFYAADRTNQQIGLVSGNGFTNPNSGSAFIGFMGSSRTGTSTNFGCATGGSGFGYDEMNTGIAQDTNYHWWEIDYSPLGSIGSGSPSPAVIVFKLDHVVVCTSIGLYSNFGNGVSPFFGVANKNSTNGDMIVDYFDLLVTVNRP